jgi:hypothetical protein
VSQSAARLSLAKSIRTGGQATSRDRLAGGGGFVVAILAAAAIIAGIVIVTESDDTADSK